jgi:hypothetical protein
MGLNSHQRQDQTKTSKSEGTRGFEGDREAREVRVGKISTGIRVIMPEICMGTF